MTFEMKALLVLFIILLAVLVFLIFFYVVTSYVGGAKQPERKWTDPKFHD